MKPGTAFPVDDRAQLGLVVVQLETLTAIVRDAVADVLQEVIPPGQSPLLDRAALAKALAVSTSTVDRLARGGLPHLLVGDAKRFELSRVVGYLQARKQGGDDGPR